MNKKTIAYIRVSTDEQAEEGYSINYQKNCAISFAMKKELKNLELFIDEGYSATNLNRPKMKKLIKLVEDDKVDNIIIYELDRLSRDTVECMSLIKLFKKKGVKLHGINFNAVFESADERFMLGIKALLGQHESEKTGERVLYGLKQSFIDGNYACSSILFGYKQVKKFVDNKVVSIKLKPIPKEINILTYSFKEYLYTDKTLDDIREDIKIIFNYEIKTNKLSAIFKNIKYTAKFAFHDLNLDGEIYGLLPIITIEEFNIIQNKLISRAKTKKYEYLFEYKVYCNHCKSPLMCKSATGRNQKIYLYYACANKICPCFKKQISDLTLLNDNKKKIVNLSKKYSLTHKYPKVKNINQLSDRDIRNIIIKHMQPIFVDLTKKRREKH